MSTFRYAVSVMPREGILDPQGRAVETSLPHLGVTEVHGVRVGRRVELAVDAADDAAARVIVERLATELFANPLIESFAVEPLDAGQRSGAPHEGRRGRLPGLQLRPRRAARGDASWARSRSRSGTSRPTCGAPTWSSCRAASPMATTSGPVRSPASAP